VLNEAKRAPAVCGLRLYVDKDNRTAAEVYRRSGMQVTHYDMLEVDFGGNG
jgi:ribosomal protein S18 acetylase RimI-like enzyme